MDRRTFVGASAMTLAATAPALADPKPAGRELYELRTFTLKPGKRPVLDAFLKDAFIPATKRHGVGPVGVFVETPEADPLRVVVLTVFPSGEAVAALAGQLDADAQFLKAAGEYVTAKAADPVYLRIESSLLAAIAGMPTLERPDTTKPRLLNLRVYESHNERAAMTKVKMFETGELAIFRRDGLTPVFFASAIVGAAMPNLTYLLAFPDEAGRKAAWDKFRADPDWLKLKAVPEYADKEIVSKITNTILAPAPYSEI